MKRTINISIVLVTSLILTSSLFAQHGQGLGNRFGLNNGGINPQSKWIDADGDGICDNFGTPLQGSGSEAQGIRKMNKMNGNPNGLGLGNGYGDGSGIRPLDGTGFGKKNGGGSGSGIGVCDGSGPKGGRK